MSKGKTDVEMELGAGGFREPERPEPAECPQGAGAGCVIAPGVPDPAWPAPAYHRNTAENLGNMLEELQNDPDLLREVLRQIVREDFVEDGVRTDRFSEAEMERRWWLSRIDRAVESELPEHFRELTKERPPRGTAIIIDHTREQRSRKR